MFLFQVEMVFNGLVNVLVLCQAFPPPSVLCACSNCEVLDYFEYNYTVRDQNLDQWENLGIPNFWLHSVYTVSNSVYTVSNSVYTVSNSVYSVSNSVYSVSNSVYTVSNQ